MAKICIQKSKSERRSIRERDKKRRKKMKERENEWKRQLATEMDGIYL